MISQDKPRAKKFPMMLLISGMILIWCSQAIGQDLTVDEVIQKNIVARGGASNWAAVKTIKMAGIYVNFSDPTPFTIWRQRPDLYRFDSTRINEFMIHAYDGEQTWWVNPFFGPQNAKPVVIPSQQNLDKVTLRERFFEPVFWNYTQNGNVVVLEGREDMDDHDCYKLKVTLADSSVEYWFIDSETFLEVGMTGDTYDFGTKTSIEMFFGDYRNVEGVMMPFLIESEYGIRYRSMEVENIAINQTIKPSVFAMPDSATWKGK
jgi:outer membrane lipoprotein-sorting protein